MTRFAAFVLSAWAAQAASENTSIMSTLQRESRSLSYSKIGGYIPNSVVTDHNALDLDQYYMEVELAKKTSTGQANALAIYEQGGNSKSYAVISLDSNLSSAIKKGTKVMGQNEDGKAVGGTVYKNAPTGQNKISVRYNTSEDQETYVMCRVGALTSSSNGRKTSGCLKSDGNVSIEDKNYAYTYDPLKDNKNGRTLQGFSTAVEEKMLDCQPGCPMADPEMFAKYYGQPDYGDRWIKAAFTGGKTDYSNGDADFKDWGYTGRNEVIKKGSVYLNVFMYVIREFEDAVIDCKTDCDKDTNCNDGPVYAWDEGVAFYSGSMEGTDGKSSGVFLHQLADKRCKNFKTCGLNGDLADDTRSYVNHELLRMFEKGKNFLLEGECGQTKPLLKKIINLMYVPMIQGSLRYAYKMDEYDNVDEKQSAEGAVFTAAVLPRVHAANPKAAKILYDNMKVGATSTSFTAVKKAYESVYDKLGISCNTVGGMYTNGKYDKGAKPCDDNAGSQKGFMFAAFGALVVVVGSIW